MVFETELKEGTIKLVDLTNQLNNIVLNQKSTADEVIEKVKEIKKWFDRVKTIASLRKEVV
jgi:hypothetical protein